MAGTQRSKPGRIGDRQLGGFVLVISIQQGAASISNLGILNPLVRVGQVDGQIDQIISERIVIVLQYSGLGFHIPVNIAKRDRGHCIVRDIFGF